ncbi:aminoglycoside phosphotransferase family protein [Microlunatus ginsengisoli]|uniref:Aminoglycoside phosphotransferase domain-containing protein n=1 Tax=Microlunatus ginsengisoli TaxID=363863 RepID=A0ABP6ZR56_9ACTN
MRLHDDEVPIDLELVRRLLRGQAPDLAGRDLRPAPAQGTDNLMFILGGDLVVRLPRKAAAVDGLLVERRWLATLAPRLPLGVPLPVVDGEPTSDYPFPWAVCRWLPGAPVAPGGLRTEDVPRLAEFVRALRAADPTGGPPVPPGRRAGPLSAYDAVFERALGPAARVDPGLVDQRRARAVWHAARDAPAWSAPGVWVHRDLYGGNLLTAGGRLSGVIDFGGLAVGDPAGDVMAAFHVVTSEDRGAFRALLAVDDDTWARGRAWALAQGLEALPYYLDTHPGMVAMARQAVAATLADQG